MFRHLYDRDHLSQVLATFGVILFLNQGVKAVLGTAPLQMPMPELLPGGVALMHGLLYPIYRLAILAGGLADGGAALVAGRAHPGGHAGARRAPATRRWWRALGVDIRRLFMLVFGFGAMLAGFAGVMAAPILSVEPGMGDNLLILAFVVIVIGGIGSRARRLHRGAAGRAGGDAGPLADAGPAAAVPRRPPRRGRRARRSASMLVYIAMALILAFRPAGLFPVRAADGVLRAAALPLLVLSACWPRRPSSASARATC